MLLEMQAPPENTSEILQLLGYCIGKTSRGKPGMEILFQYF